MSQLPAMQDFFLKKLSFKPFLFLLVLLCFCYSDSQLFIKPLSAQQNTKALTLSDVFNLAVSNNEVLALQNEAIAIAETQYKQAKSSVKPYVALAGSEIFQDTSGVTQGSGASSTFTNSRKQEYKITARQTLYSGFRDRDTLAALKSLIRKEVVASKTARIALYQSVADAYFDILLLQKDLVSTQESIDLMSARIKELNNRVRVGRSRQSEVLSAEAELANLESQKESSLGDLQRATIELSNLVGAPVTERRFSEPEATTPKLTTKQNTVANVADHTAIQGLLETYNYYEYSRLSAVHSTRPIVNAGANYYLDRTTYLDPIDWDVSLTVEIPLYRGDLEKAEASEYEANKRQIDLSVKQAERDIRSRIAADFALHESLIKQKKSLENAYQKAKAGYAMYTDEYRLGLITNLDVIRASTEVLSIKRQLDRTELMIKRNVIQIAIDYEEIQ